MKLAMVGIIVTDMKQSLAFYECLGLKIHKQYGPDYVELKNDSIKISLNTRAMITKVYGFEPSISGERVELAFEFESKNEVDNLCQKIKMNNYSVVKEPWLAPWGQYYALVSDVDGNILSLFSTI